MKTINFTKNIFFSNLSKLKRPYKLTFALTYRCNSRCKICQIWKKKPKNELSFEEIDKFFKKNNYFNWVDITGGEIFLRKDLIKITASIIENNKNLYLLHFATNSFSPKVIIKNTKIILNQKPNLLLVSVSLDGPPLIHDQLRGIDGSWKKATQLFKALKEINESNFGVVFGMTISKYNSSLINQTIDSVKTIMPGISRHDFHFNLSQKSSHYYANKYINLDMEKELIDSLDVHRHEGKSKLTDYLSLSKLGIYYLEKKYQKLAIKYLNTRETPLPCQALSASIFIDPCGNIYPCTIWDKKITNIRKIDYDLKRVFNSRKTIKLRKKILENNCPGCWTPCEAYQTILGNLI